MASIEFLNKGIEMVNKAIEEDREGSYESAYKLYMHSLDFFFAAMKYEKNEKAKAPIRRKIAEYLTRAEALKDHIIPQSNQKAATPGSTVATASTKKKFAKSQDEGDAENKKLRAGLE
ncbi:Vacuolar protein sorting-associated protein 4, partial [Spiromyces aspiralis]